jgi:hypothetical protein
MVKPLSVNEIGGGGRGIRTLGTVSRTAVFKTATLSHSVIPPALVNNSKQ